MGTLSSKGIFLPSAEQEMAWYILKFYIDSAEVAREPAEKSAGRGYRTPHNMMMERRVSRMSWNRLSSNKNHLFIFSLHCHLPPAICCFYFQLSWCPAVTILTTIDQTWWPNELSIHLPFGDIRSRCWSSRLPVRLHYNVAMSVHCHKSVTIQIWPLILPGCSKTPINQRPSLSTLLSTVTTSFASSLSFLLSTVIMSQVWFSLLSTFHCQ